MESIDAILLDPSKIIQHNNFSLQCVAQEEKVYGNNTSANLQSTKTVIISSYRWYYDIDFLFIRFPIFLKSSRN